MHGGALQTPCCSSSASVTSAALKAASTTFSIHGYQERMAAGQSPVVQARQLDPTEQMRYDLLAKMFGFATTLRSATQGRGTFSMEFSHYSAAPKNISEEIIKARNEADEKKKAKAKA